LWSWKEFPTKNRVIMLPIITKKYWCAISVDVGNWKATLTIAGHMKSLGICTGGMPSIRVVEALKYLMNDCPSPVDPKCQCGTHQFIRHELDHIHSGIPHERRGEDAKDFCWLLFQLNKKDNSVSITLDKKDSFPSNTIEENPSLSPLNISGWIVAGTSILVMINLSLQKWLGWKISPGVLPFISALIVGQIYAHKAQEGIPNPTKIKAIAYFLVMYGLFIGIPSWMTLPKTQDDAKLLSIGLLAIGILSGSAMAYLGLYFGEKMGLKNVETKNKNN